MARSVTQYFALEQSRNLLERLKNAGLNMKSLREVSDTRFAGMTFVLTGALSEFTRDEASEIIEKLGGKTSSSVSKKTSIVLVKKYVTEYAFRRDSSKPFLPSLFASFQVLKRDTSVFSAIVLFCSPIV